MDLLAEFTASMDNQNLYYALLMRREEFMNWLIDHDCPFDDSFIELAVKRMNIKALDYVANEDFCKQYCIYEYCLNEPDACALDWLIKKGFILPKDPITIRVMMHSSLEIIKYLCIATTRKLTDEQVAWSKMRGGKIYEWAQFECKKKEGPSKLESMAKMWGELPNISSSGLGKMLAEKYKPIDFISGVKAKEIENITYNGRRITSDARQSLLNLVSREQATINQLLSGIPGISMADAIKFNLTGDQLRTLIQANDVINEHQAYLINEYIGHC